MAPTLAHPTSSRVGGGDATVSAAVLALPERCYRCGHWTRSIVGVLVAPALTAHPDGFVGFDAIARPLAQRVTPAQLARCGIGPIKIRRSRLRPEGYLSNGCIHCDAIQGSFPLHEDLIDFLAEGGEYRQIVVAHWRIPRNLLPTRD